MVLLDRDVLLLMMQRTLSPVDAEPLEANIAVSRVSPKEQVR